MNETATSPTSEHPAPTPPESGVPAPVTDEILLPDSSRRMVIIQCALLILFMLAVPRAAGWLEAQVYNPWNPYTPPLARWLFFDVFLAGLTTGMGLFLLWTGSQPLRSLGLHGANVETQLLWGIAATVSMLVIDFLGSWLMIWIRHRTGAEWLESSALESSFTADVAKEPRLSIVLLMTALGVFAEELLFRGLLLTRLRRALGSWWAAVLTTSILFGIWHLDWSIQHSFAGFLISLPLCLVFVRQRSLLAPMTGHFLYNIALVTLNRIWD